jgi:mRNA-degrading endonuclease YafQ of YafQ-DinJ toxin-antitoxin module
VRENFGRPHLHAGTGIRDLSPKGSKEGIYECRINRSVRLVFTVEAPSILYFHMMGNHDDVKRYLRRAL